jgi:hypothetical protein
VLENCVICAVPVALEITADPPKPLQKVETAVRKRRNRLRKDFCYLLNCNGGADRNRTCDLLIANETLYQLSYDPIPSIFGLRYF